MLIDKMLVLNSVLNKEELMTRLHTIPAMSVIVLGAADKAANLGG